MVVQETRLFVVTSHRLVSMTTPSSVDVPGSVKAVKVRGVVSAEIIGKDMYGSKGDGDERGSDGGVEHRPSGEGANTSLSDNDIIRCNAKIIERQKERSAVKLWGFVNSWGLLTLEMREMIGFVQEVDDRDKCALEGNGEQKGIP